MTTGTVHTFDAARGTGTLRCISGSLAPFSTRGGTFNAGDRVTFRLSGGVAGLYATHVDLVASRQVVLSEQVFRRPVGLAAMLAG